MRLPQILDLGAAAPLWSDVIAAKGGPLELDASGVERMGGLCLQVLLAAKSAWATQGKPFAIVNPSPAFLAAAAAMGASDQLELGAST